MNQTDGIQKQLRSASLRATRARTEILTHLNNTHAPYTIQELTKALPSLDPATVYRTVPEFLAAGLIHEVSLGDGKSRYEYAAANDDHHHVICTSCGTLEDIDICESNTLDIRAEKSARGFAHIDRHSLEFFGTCNSCAH